MRHAQAFLISTGLFVAGLLVAACGATHSTTTARQTSSAATTTAAAHTNAAVHAHIGFVSPRAGANVGSTVHVRVRLSQPGHVRFILDGGRAHMTTATTITYRNLTPGGHRVEAELPAASGHGLAATAVIRFHVRRPPVTVAPTPPPPVTTTTAASPPVQGPATTAPPPTTAAPPPSTGIPQNGGGDDDSDNHGGPSDGDGNL